MTKYSSFHETRYRLQLPPFCVWMGAQRWLYCTAIVRVYDSCIYTWKCMDRNTLVAGPRARLFQTSYLQNTFYYRCTSIFSLLTCCMYESMYVCTAQMFVYILCVATARTAVKHILMCTSSTCTRSCIAQIITNMQLLIPVVLRDNCRPTDVGSWEQRTILMQVVPQVGIVLFVMNTYYTHDGNTNT